MNPDAILEPDQLIADAIDGAEEIPDPLAGLAEKTANDPGAPFMPETLDALAALKSDNRAAFEALRSQLKKAGCRVTALDDAIAEESGDTGGRGPTQADILIGLAQTAELFHTADGAGFADLDINGHRETWPIRAKGFRRWLARCFFEETGGAPSSEALQSALNVIEAKAHFDAPERQVHIRVGGLDGRLYLDLGDETWRAVEIDATGWRVIDHPPVRFRRASGMKPMPIPVHGGSIETLRSFLNVQTDADFVLVVAWALACLRNRGPYPVIALSGEQGSAKSTFSAILRALLDPNACHACGCAVVGEIKKQRYVYYHCTGYADKCQGNPSSCRREYVREEALEALFTELLGRLRFDDEVLEWVRDALHASHADERREHEEAIRRHEAENKRLTIVFTPCTSTSSTAGRHRLLR